MDRRAFLAGLTATAAGLLVPERRIWALDRTMLRVDADSWPRSPDFFRIFEPGDRIGITVTGTGTNTPFVEVDVNGFLPGEFLRCTGFDESGNPVFRFNQNM